MGRWRSLRSRPTQGLDPSWPVTVAGRTYVQRPCHASRAPGGCRLMQPPPLDAASQPVKTARPTHVHRGSPTSSGPARPSIGSGKADPRQASPAECTELSYPPIRFRLPGGLGRRASSPRCSRSRSACSRRAQWQLEPLFIHARSRTAAALISRARRSAIVNPPTAGTPQRGARRSVRPRMSTRRSTGPQQAPTPTRAAAPLRVL